MTTSFVCKQDGRGSNCINNCEGQAIALQESFIENCAPTVDFTIIPDFQLAWVNSYNIKAASTLDECKCFCENYPDCKSIFYEKNTNKCQLGSELTYGTVYAAKPDWDTGFKNGMYDKHLCKFHQ